MNSPLPPLPPAGEGRGEGKASPQPTKDTPLPPLPSGEGRGEGPRPAPNHKNAHLKAGALAALLVLLADQATKWAVLNPIDLPAQGTIPLLPILNLTMVWNQGVTFGLFHQDGAAGPWILGGVSLAVVAAIAYWLTRAESALVATALGAIAGGAVGNVIDRFRFGAVVDFIHAHAGPWSWYVFNVADAAIVCGVAALLLDGLRTKPQRLQAPGVGQ